MKRSTRRAGTRAGMMVLFLGVSLGLVLGAMPLAPAFADETPADSTKATGETKATDETKSTEKTTTTQETKATDAKGEVKEKTETKSKTKKSTKTKSTKGGTVTEGTKAAPGTMPVKPAVEPQHVQVQHILIGFAGSIPGKGITRSKEDAKKLAYEILEKARSGEDFDTLVRQYTEDSPPGIYGMSGIGVPPDAGEFARDKMVPAFGNVGFAISPGNIGIADYDPQASPYGWHIIKRLK